MDRDSDSPASNAENIEQLEEEEDEGSDQFEDRVNGNNNDNINHNNSTSPQQQRKPLHERSLQGMLVLINKNSYPRGSPKRYRLTSLEKLLNESMNLLSLNSQAKKIFNEDGNVVKDISEVSKNQILYISSGEKFNYGIPSPSQLWKQSPKKEPQAAHEEEEEKPEQPQEKQPEEKQPEEPVKTKAELILEKKQKRFAREVLSFNRILHLSQRTIEESFHEATASVFEALGENQKRRLVNWPSVQAVHDDTQLAMLQAALIGQKICPSTSDVLVEVDNFVLDMLKGISLNDVKFVVTGPRQSGKTTLLYSITTKFAKKLQVSDESSTFLFFPLNFELQTLELGNHNSLLRLFLSTIFDSLEYSCFTVLPYLQPLRQWFIMTVFGAQMQLPTGISLIKSINVRALQELAKGLSSSLKGTGPNGLQSFLQKVCSLPDQFAKAVGLQGAIFVLDSFEYSDFFFNPSESSFPESLRPVSFSQCLCAELSKSLYIVSLQDEQHFMECFSCNDAALIDTEGLLMDLEFSSVIFVRQPPLRIAMEDCLGCPGYINKFDKLCNFVRTMQVNASSPSPYSTMKTASDMSRMKMVKQELIRFCQLLMYGGSTLVNKELLNDIIEEENLVVRIDDPIDEEEEEEEADEKKTKKNKFNNNKDGQNKNGNDSDSTGTVDLDLNGPENVQINAGLA